MRPVVGLLIALFTLAPVSGALALDYRVTGDNEMGLGLIDADSVTAVGTKRRFALTVIFAQKDGRPADVGVASVLIDCDQDRYRIESVVSYDLDLKETARDPQASGWQIPDEDTPFFPAAAFVCRGGPLPKAEARELKDILAGFLLRRSGATSV